MSTARVESGPVRLRRQALHDPATLDSGARPPPLVRTLVLSAVLATVYVLTGSLGLQLATLHESATLVWPPSGLVLASLLMWGKRLWPGVFAGAFVVNLINMAGAGPAAAVGASFGIALGNTLEAVVGSMLVSRFANGRDFIIRAADVFRFIVAALLSATISASIGLASLELANLATGPQALPIALTWWLGDAASDLVLVPLLLGWTTMRDRRPWSPLPRVEAGLLFLFVVLVGGVVFGDWLSLRKGPYPISFLVLPLIVWAALRFPQYVSAVTVFILSAISLEGQFSGTSPVSHEALFLVQSFISVTAMTSMVLAAVVAERRRARDELRALFENAQDSMLIIDADRRCVDANPAACAMSGYSPGELIGRHIDDLTPNDDREAIAGQWREFLEKGRLAGEMRIRRKDGRCVDVEFRSVANMLPGLHLSVLRDVTARKLAETKVRRMNEELERRVEERTAKLREALREIDTFSYSVAHDLRGPLRAMTGFSEALLQDYGGKLDSEGNDFLGRIADAGRRMDALITDILNYSRLSREEVPLGPVDLSGVVERVLENLSKEIVERRAKVTVRPPLPPVLGHASMMEQVVTNLVSNGIKFSRTGVDPEVTIGAEPRGGMVRIWVEDNGIGIPPEYKDRVFGLFQRLNPVEAFPGTGVGLAIVRRAMERMGGRSGFESTPGRGSRFWVEIPAAPPSEGGRP
jgi:PAS domain S-box-containing protein